MYTATVNKTEFSIEFDKKNKNTGKINGEEFALDIIQTKKDSFHLIKNNRSYNIDVVKADFETKEFEIKINGNKYTAAVKDDFDRLLKRLGMDAKVAQKLNQIKAPMPGMVLDIVVKEGDSVKKGDSLFVLEAMKMENNIKSPGDGVVKKILCKKGLAVEKNEVLIVFE